MNECFHPRRVLPQVDLGRTRDFDLGTVRVSPSRRKLLPPGGEAIDLEPRVMQVLVALHEARGAVVSRDALIDSCWSGRLVGDDALNRCIVALRRVARAMEPSPFQIETVARVGYRLVPCETIAAGPPPGDCEASPFDIVLPPDGGPRWRAAAAAGSLLILALGTVAAYRWAPPAAEIRRAGTSPLALAKSSEAERLHGAAVHLFRQRNRAAYEQSERLLRRAVASDPSHAPSWARLGMAVFASSWWLADADAGGRERLRSEALRLVRRGLSIDPRLGEGYAAMGLIYAGSSAALPWLERAVQLDPSDPEAWLWLGNARQYRHDLRGAIIAYERSVAIDPVWHRAVGNYANALHRAGRRREAHQLIDDFFRETNGNHQAHMLRQDLFLEEGRLLEAAEAAAAALAAGPPTRSYPRYTVAALALQLGDSATVGRLLALEPDLQERLSSYADRAEAVRLAHEQPDAWWDGVDPGARARHLLPNHSGLLVQLYDRRYGSPVRFWTTGRHPQHGVAPALILALRSAGREREADAIRDLLAREVADRGRGGDRSMRHAVLASQLAAIDGGSIAAARWIEVAVQWGWKGQYPDLGPGPQEDPVYRSVGRDAAFQAAAEGFQEAVAAEAARLRAARLSSRERI